MHLTNLPPLAPSFFHAPCALPAFADSEPSTSSLVLIDHEDDNTRLEAGDPEAHDLAASHVQDFRRLYPRASLGLYGLPYPRNPQQVIAFSNVFLRLLGLVDFLAPCCYVANDSDGSAAIARGHHFRTCISLVRSPRVRHVLPRYGVVSPWLLDSSRACTPHEIRVQCKAARAAGCTSLYVWSGIGDKVWRAVRPASQGEAHFDDTQLARATLLGSYGLQIDDWTNLYQVDLAVQGYARDTLDRFLAAWADT